LITGGARLMLALLERCISDVGGTYAMEDTDSIAMVATEKGGMIPCPGGPYRTRHGGPVVKALSWSQVDEIVTRFERLNPYDRKAVPRSVLKIEDDNRDRNTGKRRQIYCYAISAKRYALFVRDASGRPVPLRADLNNHADHWSEHGLGHLLNPSDPESEDRNWISHVWQSILSRSLSFEVRPLSFADVPAVGRITVSSPAVMRAFASFNEGKKYTAQIKPFNFVLTCHVQPFGHPSGSDPERFHLIAPYETDPRRWLTMPWIDQYTGRPYKITTAADHGSRCAARVKTYGEVALEYEFHSESKCADANGNPCDKPTVGLLQRRHVRVDLIRYIGKESNSLEEVDAGLIHSEHGVYTEYTDARRDEWQVKTLPALKALPLAFLLRESGLSRRAILDIRAGRSRPHARNRMRFAELVGTLLHGRHI
jgi:hypothetical protein